MKREFPVLWAKVSMWVASPLILLVTVLYVLQAISRSAADVYAVGMTAFGMTAALAGICFTVPKEADGSSDTHYAGEKFLHSALLLIQSLMIIYVKEVVTASAWGHAHPGISNCSKAVLEAVLSLVSTAAAFCWFWGFEVVNSRLWENWAQRMGRLRGAQPPKDAPSGISAPQSSTAASSSGTMKS